MVFAVTTRDDFLSAITIRKPCYNSDEYHRHAVVIVRYIPAGFLLNLNRHSIATIRLIVKIMTLRHEHMYSKPILVTTQANYWFFRQQLGYALLLVDHR